MYDTKICWINTNFKIKNYNTSKFSMLSFKKMNLDIRTPSSPPHTFGTIMAETPTRTFSICLSNEQVTRR